MRTRLEFAKEIRHRFVDEFNLLAETIHLIEGVVGTKRKHETLVALAQDLLFVQTFKGVISAFELALLGHLEDTATMARRLLEIGVQAAYIDKNGEQAAGAYLSNLWDELGEVHSKLPPNLVQYWTTRLADHLKNLDPNRNKWGPTFHKMFVDVGAKASYEDYALLSAVAHGSNEGLLLTFSDATVQIRDTAQIGNVIRYCPNYALITVTAWNNVFGIIPDHQLQPLILTAADKKTFD